MRIQRFLTPVAAALLLGLAACENETLLPSSRPVNPMFERYVALGNSITAGFQSAGILDSVQGVAYPVLLARAMGSVFFVPYMARAGCPPPLTNVFTQQRFTPTGFPPSTAASCYLRASQFPPPFLSNLGVPGAEVLEAFNYTSGNIIPSSTDVYRTFLLGGHTQVAAARRAQPTFVSVWLGNNDVLGAILDQANAGNPALVTPPDSFTARLTVLLDSLDEIGTIQGGVLIGAVQVALAPYSSQGRVYFAVAATRIPTLTVLPNCLAAQAIPGGTAPLDSARVLIPFHYGAPLVAQAAGGTPTTLDCSVNQVISVTESLNMISAVAQYNAAISAAASARGWAYVDPNPLLGALLADTSAIRPFPNFPTNPAAPSQAQLTAPFGTAISRDGIHPSTATHRTIAQALQAAINARYGTTIPAVP